MKHILVMLLLVLSLTGCAAGGGTVSCYTSPPEVQTEPTVETDAPIITALPDPSVLMAECEEPFSLSFPSTPSPDEIPVFIHNDSGLDAQVLLIPVLERETGNGSWESVPFRGKIGFCGTPDPLPCEGKEWNLDTILLYGQLTAGTYRLSYTVTDADGAKHTASGTFQVGSSVCGYPTSKNFG